MLTARGKLVRGVAMAASLVLLLMGTLRGDDDHFPFGPMRMYSRRISTSGLVRILRFEGVTHSGETVSIRSGSFGMRPAEVEGQLDRLEDEPDLLRHMVTAYERMNEHAPRLVELRLVIGTHQLERRRSVSFDEEIVASWSRP